LRCTGPAAAGLFQSAPRDQWHYRSLLPIPAGVEPIALGEGATPLLRANADLGAGGAELWIKNEASNPTGSYKDRQVAVGITHARAMGHDTVALVSSGNVACSAAAYAARAGMRAIVMTHAHAAPQKLKQAAAYGATVLRVQSPSSLDVFGLCIDACRRNGWYHLSTAGNYEPYNVEGAKTIAYELYSQFGAEQPGWIVMPVGSGGLLGGVWRGLLDMQRLGLIERLPRLAGVQPKGCAPLVRAFDEAMTVTECMQTPWPNPKTVAGGLADDIPFDAHTALPALRRTNGAALAVTDEATLAAQTNLARAEGLLCEPSSAVVFAALGQLLDIPPGTRVCCILTGNGIKDLDALDAGPLNIVDVEPEPGAVIRALGETG
jgi:threonine synthase